MAFRSTVVILNGVGSVGKTSIARALQAISRDALLHVRMDAFLDMLPERLMDDPATFHFVRETLALAPSVRIDVGPAGKRLMSGMRAAVGALADAGNSLVVDEVMLGGEADEYRRRLSGHALHLVGVHAPLEIIEERERLRGDRMIGLARWQFDKVHRGIAYDLDISTADEPAASCATRIRDAFDL
jgi:chloramphenicol 3-O phosphotransferase